ncbi:DUF92 domain-containing protein [Aspergillus sclerotialis]|uniref:DUF92 domain-containing protein n=1 Tax=Aspergillus sclerotialis TaxID=2070753 RepID=A0A3A2Z5K4_9EURO|nr:DUF92 domain-containing protein [Aspergillus sclerotialis]
MRGVSPLERIRLIYLPLGLLRISSSPSFPYNLQKDNADTQSLNRNYAAVTADTFSSELGILSSSPPRLITSPSFRVVPRGTNGGVTLTGLLAGAGGAFLIATLSGIMLPGCSSLESSGSLGERAQWILAMTIWGGIGSVVDSVLGGLVQASVVDKRSGKVVEGSGGKKVLLHPSSTKPTTTDNPATSTASLNTSSQLRNTEAIANTATLRGSRVTGTSEGTQPGRPHDDKHESRRVESGRDWLDNNAVNLLMASIMSFGAMGIASLVWG